MQKVSAKASFILSFCLLVLLGKNFAQTLYTYPESSVLATGDWYKLGISKTGIYKITYTDLKNLGIDVGSLNPKNIALFGNGGGMLPENNRVFRYNDLIENAIYISSSGETFGTSDYILFYAQGPNNWKYDSQAKKHVYENHAYSMENYYFLTVTADIGTGKRIKKGADITAEETKVITTFNDFVIRKKEIVNMHLSGREWLGEAFSANRSSYSFPFSFPNIVSGSELSFSVAFAARSLSASNFQININGTQYATVNISNTVSESEYEYNSKVSNFTVSSSGNDYILDLKYNVFTSGGTGWLDYIQIHALRNLVLFGEQMSFQSVESVEKDAISLFKIQNTTSNTVVWDVSNPIIPVEMPLRKSGTEASFKVATDTMKEFIVFNGSSLHPSFPTTKLKNQNLHATPQTDYVIVTHPNLKEQANQLAELHSKNNGLDVQVVTFEQVYNEFSSGTKDAMAIRAFMKMLYDRSKQGKGKAPSYLLILGSGTYDNKNILNDPKSLTLIYQAPGYFGYATDDCFGYLDDNNASLNIGIGRFPAQTPQEAQDLVDKSTNYMLRKDITEQNMRGDWRSTVCLIADDPDDSRNNQYLANEERIANLLVNRFPNIHAEKIYADAYKQTSSTNGPVYPEVSKAITNRVNNGCLMMSYVGHGSENKLGHEGYITQSDIISWTNKYKLPLFVTNTCEFARLDKTGGNKKSAGENIVLSPNGACIALISATRKVSTNDELNRLFFTSALTPIDGKPATFGDIIRLSKNGESSTDTKMYMLIGDPALRISLPQNTIKTTFINNRKIEEDRNDTLKALMQVSIQGEMIDEVGNVLSDFSGTIYPSIYDKPLSVKTLGNEGEASIVSFPQENGLLYKGMAKVINGKFDFSFIVPKDIAYNYGFGKIYYYAANSKTDAAGFYTNVIIGGKDGSVSTIETYPDIRLYMNDTNFISGSLTDENPQLIARISDQYGINTVGSGIGHDITAILDKKPNELVTLNSYFEPDPENPARGFVYYQLNDLEPGEHILTVKAWNIFNYSTSSTIRFVVQSSDHFELGKFRNYPNPFNYSTNFILDHNYPDKIASAEIHIINSTGQLVTTLQTAINSNSSTIGPVQWNGTNGGGKKLPAGVYIARIVVQTTTGETKYATEKTILLPN